MKSRDHFRFTPLLVALIATLSIPPNLFDNFTWDALLRTVLLLAGARAVGNEARHLWVMSLFIAPAVVALWYFVQLRETWMVLVATSCFLAFLSYIAGWTLWSILRVKMVNRDVLLGGVALYLLFGYIFGIAYVMVATVHPGSFLVLGEPLTAGPMQQSRVLEEPLFYFSFVTLTSVGYGDVVPTTVLARRLAVAEGILGQLYLAVFVGRLVGFTGPRGSSPPLKDPADELP